MTPFPETGRECADVRCDELQFDRNRAAFLEHLYELCGRSDPAHPQHHTYTGLAEDFKQSIGQLVLDELTRGWHLDRQPVIRLDLDFREGAPGGAG